ncbi:MAG: hypothetical protein ACO265_05685 [Polynucleobacter sp.]|jgi:hypothetical protein
MNYLDSPQPPNLPYAPPEWNPQYQEQLNNVLRLYFNRLSNVTRYLLGPDGGRFMSNPFGAWSSDSDQTASSTTTAYAITYDVTDISDSVYLDGTSKLTVTHPGIYNLQFSIQFTNTDTQIHDVDVWVAVNGSNVSNTNSRFSVPNSHGGTDGHLIAALNVFLSMQSGDYVELYWATNNTGVRIEHIAAASSPTRPATPSVIATMSFVSSIPG